MMTLLKSATNGWLDYTQQGKYAALLLAAILYLGYCLWKSKAARNGGKQPLFYLYAVLITLACICPGPTLMAGRTPAWNRSVSRKICPSVMEMTFVGI